MENKLTIPKMEDLVKDYDNWTSLDEFTFLLNQAPPKTWVKEHPYIKNWLYLPIEKVEYLLKKIFKDYQIEIKHSSTSFNGVVVTVRVHYFQPVLGQWRYQDGIGAIQLQTAKGTSPTQMENINNGAISMAYPIAEAFAIKDACDKIGRIFGADLNRKDTTGYEQFLNTRKGDKLQLIHNSMIQKINATTDIEELDNLWSPDFVDYPEAVQEAYNKKREELRP